MANISLKCQLMHNFFCDMLQFSIFHVRTVSQKPVMLMPITSAMLCYVMLRFVLGLILWYTASHSVRLGPRADGKSVENKEINKYLYAT